MTLRKEIVLVLVFKALLILLIWAIYFSHPIENELNIQRIQQHVLGVTMDKKEGDSHV